MAALASVALLSALTGLLATSPLAGIREFAAVTGAGAGILLIIAGSYVLEMAVPDIERQARLRARFGLVAHVLAAVAVGLAMAWVPGSLLALSVLLMLEAGQSVRYLVILRNEG